MINKNSDFSKLRSIIKRNVKELFLIGEAAFYLEKTFCGLVDIKICRNLDEAVFLSYKKAKSNDIVLFSPGCSSFDMYKNYKERGEHFKKLVYELRKV